MYGPEEREKVRKALGLRMLEEAKGLTSEETEEVVDNLLALAEVLHKVWLRHTPKPQKLAPPQRIEGGEGRGPPR